MICLALSVFLNSSPSLIAVRLWPCVTDARFTAILSSLFPFSFAHFAISPFVFSKKTEDGCKETKKNRSPVFLIDLRHFDTLQYARTGLLADTVTVSLTLTQSGNTRLPCWYDDLRISFIVS